MVDHGAPQISLAEAEFINSAKHWQAKAAEAANWAQHYTELASSMRELYRGAMRQSCFPDGRI